MSNEKLLAKLIKVREGNIGLLDDVISDLKLEIKCNVNYKRSDKTKISAIKKVLKRQEKIRPILSAYHINSKDKIEFTDSYRAYEINKMDLPFKRAVDNYEEHDKDTTVYGTYPNLDHLMKSEDLIKNDNYIKIDLNINDIIGAYKVKEDKMTCYPLYAGDTEINVDVTFLKESIDILGKNITCYGRKELEPVYLYNDNDEIGLLLPIKKN